MGNSENGGFSYVREETFYEDEPIRLSPERAKSLPPKEYRAMRNLAFDSPFSPNNESKIFYLQARYMEQFEDDCPCDREVQCYYPTYEKLSTAELRGYFTWRTRLRRGELCKTSLSYAYIYLYELLHQIGSATAEEGLERLIWFYEQYSALDPGIRRYARQWIVDYAVYYNQSAERVREYADTEFDEALDALRRCGEVGDEVLFPAVLRLSSYRLEKSRAFREHREELSQVVCEVYRRLDARYAGRYNRPYAEKLYGSPITALYFPFRRAVFFDRERREHYEYRVSPMQCYRCEQNQWSAERACLTVHRSVELGEIVRTADRLAREAWGIRPGLKPVRELNYVVKFIREAIERQKEAARPRVEFDLSLLGEIRRSSETIGQKLMTEEERYVETGRPTVPAAGWEMGQPTEPDTAVESPRSVSAIAETENASAACPLTGDGLRFMRILLYGGDLQSFLSEKHLMVSVLAESVNEQLYDEFADTVIEFDGDTPVIVEDYMDDLKGMIPS